MIDSKFTDGIVKPEPNISCIINLTMHDHQKGINAQDLDELEMVA